MSISSKSKSIKGDQRGFTLIEVMVALVIFAIGITATYTLQTRSASTAWRANRVSASSTMATYIVENFLALDYSDSLLENDAGNAADGFLDIDDTASGTPDGTRYIGPDGSVNLAASADDLYSIYWNIADDRPIAGIKHIRVTVIKNNGLNAGVLYSHDYFKSNENL